MSTPELFERLRFLIRVTDRERQHLVATTERLFDRPFTPARAQGLADDIDLAERVDAFVTRFGRLQDTLGDKLLPALLQALGERPGAVIDNLDRAERLGLLPSAEQWLAVRKLRNQMVHEYVEDMALLADALEQGHRFVSVLAAVQERLAAEVRRREQARSDNRGPASGPV